MLQVQRPGSPFTEIAAASDGINAPIGHIYPKNAHKRDAGDGMAKVDPETAKMTPKETLSSTTVKIEPHRGHKVTVMGPTMMEETEKMMETKMTVTSLEDVSTTCP